MIRSLYLSHNGMTEPLGRSQVIPYLVHLAREGVRIEVVAFEPASARTSDVESVAALLARDGIGYRPLRRRADPRLGTKVQEVARAVVEGLREATAFRPDIVHCRSYLPTAAGDLVATLVPGASLLFDCRGMLGDEYVDAGHWTTDDLRYRLVKSAERRFFRRAEGVVVLTEALARWLREEGMVGASTRLQVIPCCVDMDRFRVDLQRRAARRSACGFGDEPVLVYSGTLGSWYREDDMAAFAAAAHRREPRVRFQVLTRADSTALVRKALALGFPEDRLHVASVAPDAMPDALAAGDIGLSFIEPCFSKMGSSPTKVAEYLACGLVVVANEGVGDTADLRGEKGACITMSDMAPTSLEAAVDDALEAASRPWSERLALTSDVAARRFGLAEVGGPRYLAIYRALAGGS